jgi:KaiC/GvpD/RAD55 family RecA-like ATPase
MSPTAPYPAEETSLTRLLQSLLQDIALPPGLDSGFAGASQSTPDYVPARATPLSRAMIIGPGKDSSEWEGQGEESAKPPTTTPAGKPTKPADVQPPSGKIPVPTPSVAPKRDQAPEKAPEKPSKVEKQPEKPSKDIAPKKETRAPQSFDHIFQLTQGNLESTGLVIINGEAGSGRTTLCSGLTSNYMKMGIPCMYLTYDQSPPDLRGQMKKLGTDVAQYESGYRLIIVDGFASQSESFSMEPYNLEQPFSFDNIQETLMRNSQMFMGEKVKIIFDSLDGLASKVPAKDFAKGFADLVGKLKDSGATFIVTIDLSKLSKDLVGPLNDLADCVVDLSKDDSDPNGRQLKVQRLNQKSTKIDPETFEIDASKGLVFV